MEYLAPSMKSTCVVFTFLVLRTRIKSISVFRTFSLTNPEQIRSGVPHEFLIVIAPHMSWPNRTKIKSIKLLFQ